mmetsp:Transcript_101931/g.233436  ORF Transcript_101931/g.233436 Transcript_101931/m.233436 type:complete len:232 (-) Transcript_101931:86-781(-)
MQRHLSEVEASAQEAVRDHKEWEQHVHRCLEQEREDVRKRRGMNRQNQEFLRQQMEWKQRKRGNERDDYLVSACMNDFMTLAEPLEYPDRKRKVATALKRDLDKQVMTAQSIREREDARERALDAQQMDKAREELVTIRQQEAEKKEAWKHDLLESWGGQKRMKNIKQAVQNFRSGAAPHQSHVLLEDAQRPMSASSDGSRRLAAFKGASRSLALHRESLSGVRPLSAAVR